ncbi:DNA-binding response regulator [Laceyella sacchari]|uniref:Two-component system, OmpR family, alkaline phosphatase synthesis response regulator PhoP n=2 Tax=Laceyella TaxID=292635 RepID=A0AA45WJT9_9BACL|nr:MULTISPECIES: response regulator transcription factor [Laceyella]AUS08236.1 DNA-binding response regulator [Laceyella sacchari]MRG26905.1 response regulator [Laceyella tengchongensis]PRZ16047.1 two-component system alkaline phosphatase synthesis response regulator PhoP [Laceyella sediminis]SMP04131.1 two-component system, OmpR family, alkaline phosphatase synthesis response regulator PhoP [Laceyella tengchongensis]
MGKKILVVDDEASIVKLVQFNLEKEGFQVDVAYDGEMALDMMKNGFPDLLILDLMLPKLDGLEVCRRLRQEKKHIPILMLTAKTDEFDKVLGLELGADDYMTKPFSPRELTARVKAILRRIDALKGMEQTEEKEALMRIGELVIDPEGYVITRNGEEIDLTPKEFELLLYMANHRGKVLSRDQLLNAVWNYDYIGDSRIVDVHVSHLREKIETDSRSPIYIKTVRGIGYKFEGPRRG